MSSTATKPTSLAVIKPSWLVHEAWTDWLSNNKAYEGPFHPFWRSGKEREITIKPLDELVHEMNVWVRGSKFNVDYYIQGILNDPKVGNEFFREYARSVSTDDICEVSGPYSNYCTERALKEHSVFKSLISVDDDKMFTPQDYQAKRDWEHLDLWGDWLDPVINWRDNSWPVWAMQDMDSILYRVAFHGLDLYTPVPKMLEEEDSTDWKDIEKTRDTFQPFIEWLSDNQDTYGAPIVDLFKRARADALRLSVFLPAKLRARSGVFASKDLINTILSYV